MSVIVEHNDVDIAPLFSWSKKFEVISNGDVTPVFMRVLGDADMGKARVSALRKSAELRKKLKDTNSDERIAFIKDIDDLTSDLLVDLITIFSIRDLTDRATTKLKIKPPKAPKSDAKTVLHERYQEEVDSYPDRRQLELRDLLNKEVTSFKKILQKEDKDFLYNKYVSVMVDELCEQELLNSFKSWCSYLGSYKNEQLTEKLFSSYEEFSNLSSDLKLQFINEYSSLELYGDDLKKLRQVTP